VRDNFLVNIGEIHMILNLIENEEGEDDPYTDSKKRLSPIEEESDDENNILKERDPNSVQNKAKPQNEQAVC
jgi:hypothetical protein